jgi:hypothetical protein
MIVGVKVTASIASALAYGFEEADKQHKLANDCREQVRLVMEALSEQDGG